MLNITTEITFFFFLALALVGIVPPKCPVSVKSIVGVF